MAPPNLVRNPSPQATPYRPRLLDGLAAALVDRAYTDLTIADIVARARVSKRTFYEHFESKDACLLALGERLSEQTLALIAASYQFGEDWVAQLRSVTHAFLSSLETQPALVQALYIDLLSIGPAGLALRRRLWQRFADFLIMQVDAFRVLEPLKKPLSPAMATAVVGGINELILQAIEQGQADHLSDLTPTVTAFVQAVLSALDAPIVAPVMPPPSSA